ncbi:LOW QUALITY PROTEIN: tripartite motif-containing protein 42 [Rhynochetos jubatus]
MAKNYPRDMLMSQRYGLLEFDNEMVLSGGLLQNITALDNIRWKKQEDVSEYINYTCSLLSYIHGLIQDSKEALKVESQVVFLQSAHCLVKEIENAVPSVFQPSPRLREDPLRKPQLNFDELFSILQGLVPFLSGMKLSESKAEKYPYSFNPEIMVPRHVSNTHQSKQATLFQSQSLNSLFDFDVPPKDTVRRTSSTPPHHPTQSNEVCASSNTACETPRKRKYQFVNFPSPEPTDNGSAPGPVATYQTLVYPWSAKIRLTCPKEDMGFFKVEF